MTSSLASLLLTCLMPLVFGYQECQPWWSVLVELLYCCGWTHSTNWWKMNSDLEAISLSVPSLGQSLDMIGWSTAESSSGMNPGAGTFWHDPSVCKSAHPVVISLPSDCGTLLTTGKCKIRAVTVAYVRNSETSQSLSSENMALQCLKDACDIVGCKLDVIPFGKLDFGETSVLDHFYNAGKSTKRSLGMPCK